MIFTISAENLWFDNDIYYKFSVSDNKYLNVVIVKVRIFQILNFFPFNSVTFWVYFWRMIARKFFSIRLHF